MKRILLLCLLLSTCTTLWGQNEQPLPPTLRQLTLDQKTWMTTNGFPISTYDFSRPDINLELVTALSNKNKGKHFTTLGYALVGVGAILLFAPRGTSTSRAQTLAIGSRGMLLGGITLGLVGMSKKLKAKKQIERASYLYYENR